MSDMLEDMNSEKVGNRRVHMANERTCIGIMGLGEKRKLKEHPEII